MYFFRLFIVTISKIVKYVVGGEQREFCTHLCMAIFESTYLSIKQSLIHLFKSQP